MEYILKTEALTKQYNKRNAIDNVDIAIRLGAVYGLVGRNGAGKTLWEKAPLLVAFQKLLLKFIS